MFKKIILSILILFIGYIILIFIYPNIAFSISKLLGIEGFNQKIIDFKSTFDKQVTKIPEPEKILSGAIDIKNNIIDGVNTTKEKIDTIRETMSGVENTYNDLKENYDKVKNFIDTNSGKIDETKNIINNISNILSNTGETN